MMLSMQSTSNARRELIQELLDCGLGVFQIAKELGVHHNNIRRTIAKYSLDVYVAFDEIPLVQTDNVFLIEYEYEDYWDDFIRNVFSEGEAVITLEDDRVKERRYLRDRYGGLVSYLLIKGYGRLRKYIKIKCCGCQRIKSILQFNVRSDSLLGINSSCNTCESRRQRSRKERIAEASGRKLGIARRWTSKSFAEEVWEKSDGQIKATGKYERADIKMRFMHVACGVSFYATPNNVLQGSRCPICRASKGEQKVRTKLQKMSLKFTEQRRFKDCRYKNPLPFDFSVEAEEKEILIEYDGAQHFIAIDAWGGESNLEAIKRRDRIKTDYCLAKGIPLIRIDYTQFDEIESVLESELSALGVTGGHTAEKIAA